MILAIDPSLNNTGFAVIKGGNILTSGVIRTNEKSSEVKKLSELAADLRSILSRDNLMISLACVEIPGSYSYERSRNKQTGRAMNQTSLHKLNRAIGVILYMIDLWSIPVEMVEVSRWKGGRKKEVDQLVASNYLSGRQPSTDEADAIMLAVWRWQRLQYERAK